MGSRKLQESCQKFYNYQRELEIVRSSEDRKCLKKIVAAAGSESTDRCGAPAARKEHSDDIVIVTVQIQENFVFFKWGVV